MKTFLFIISLSLFCTSVQAKEAVLGAHLDKQIADCSARAENTLASVDCLNQGLAAWDTLLNSQYRILLRSQPEEVKSSLRKAQRAWIKYRDDYLLAMQAFYRQQQGTIWQIVMADSALRLTRDRAVELYRLRTSTDLS